MLIPNIDCLITKAGEKKDMYGQEIQGEIIPSLCAVVRLDVAKMKSSVRADSSASRGNADERVAMARLLFAPHTNIEIDDKVTVHGIDLQAISVFPRHDMEGNIDHFQVDCDRWA